MGCGASASRNATNPGDGKDQRSSQNGEMKGVVCGGGVSASSDKVIDDKRKITEFYDVEKKKIGEGAYGAVMKCRHKATSSVRAVKSIAKSQMKNFDRFKQEISIMKLMDHPNIVQLFECFEDHRNIYLVLELCTGGELFDRIIDSGHFTEPQAAIVMQSMFRALYYMHSKNICHRDLKPENFLFTNKEAIEKSHLKVIDFGLACRYEPGQVLTTKAGTPHYVAPQVLQGKYDNTSDLWSLGVIMYVVLCGYPPFYGDTDADVLAKVKLGNFTFAAADWKNVSDGAKDLIRRLLKMNPKERATAEEALEHEWVKKKAPKAGKNVAIGAGMVRNLKAFRSQNKLKKAALHAIASHLAEDKIKGLRDIFMKLDDNGDGKLTAAEMKNGLTEAGLKDSSSDIQAILEGIEADATGVIDYTEFLSATLDKKISTNEEICWQAFCLFDTNGDGKIDKFEIEKVLNDDGVQATTAKDMAEILAEIDQNGDGEIDFDEFMQMMRGGTELQSGR